MNLWIRSQDGKRLCLAENLYIYDNIRYKEVKEKEIVKNIVGQYIENIITKQVVDEYISCEIWGSNHLLGTYNTQERALEVLDEIQDIIISTSIIPIENNEAVTCGCGKIYEMPKE